MLPQPFFHRSPPSFGHHLPQPWLRLCAQSPSVLPAPRGDLACPSTAEFLGCYLSMAWFDTSLSRAVTDGSPACSEPARAAQSQPGAVTKLIFLALSWDCSQAQLSLPSPTFSLPSTKVFVFISQPLLEPTPPITLPDRSAGSALPLPTSDKQLLSLTTCSFKPLCISSSPLRCRKVPRLLTVLLRAPPSRAP